jgi:hypothetical protein
MSQAAFANPMSPIRDTTGFDRAQRYIGGGGAYGSPPSNFSTKPGPVASVPLMPQSAMMSNSGGGANPYRAMNAEHASGGDANAYAAGQFTDWYKNQKPQDLAAFNTNPDHENAAGIQEANARQHFMNNVITKDPQYQGYASQAKDARNARIAGQSVSDYQQGQASLTGAQNTADAIKTDAAGRTAVANGQGSLLTGQGNVANAQANVLIPAQARGVDSETNARDTTSRIAGDQWNAARPLYPKQLQAGIDETNSKTGLNQAQAAATQTNATSGAVKAYGEANRPTQGKDADGNPVQTPPAFTYGAPAPGSLLPSMAAATKPPTAPVAASGAPSAGGSAPPPPPAPPGLLQRFDAAGTPAAPAAPSFLDKVMSGGKAAAASVTKPPLAWAFGAPGMAVKYAAGFAGGYQNPHGAPAAAAGAAKTINVGGVALTLQPDGTWAGANGRRYRTDAAGKFTLAS